jgi:hypothetical protein
VDLILQLQRRYAWGARKVRRLLQDRVPADQVLTKTVPARLALGGQPWRAAQCCG